MGEIKQAKVEDGYYFVEQTAREVAKYRGSYSRERCFRAAKLLDP